MFSCLVHYQSPDPVEQRTIGTPNSKIRFHKTHPFKGRECSGITQDIATRAHRKVVATQLAFETNPAGSPPDGRMIGSSVSTTICKTFTR